MCKQRGIKLAEGLQTMRRNNAILDDLLAWLNGAEANLIRNRFQVTSRSSWTYSKIIR